ncbi:MAG: hypothetical protein BZ137_07695 [Methanosphaera sp. rholeuAM130]|nr:MAG: hypothetical protein BZ137_07695 [Methanosphaera sp. rholeuAM130]
MPSKIDNLLILLNKDSVNVYATYSNDEIIVENIKRQCPYCNRRKIYVHEWNGRTLHFYDIQNVRVKVPRYECARCGRIFMADLTSIVDKSANFTNNFKEGLLNKFIETDIALFQAKYDMERRYKHVISHQSIENYILELSKELKYTPLASRGYLLFDVQWIKLKKKCKYRFALYELYQD